MQNKTVFLVCFTAAMAGLVFGIDIGVIAQAKDFIKQDLQVDDTVISWVVGSMMGGATAGAMVSGILTRRLGRKVSLLLSGICFVLGSLFCAISTSGAMLIVSRIIVGLSVGIASFTAPLYLSEVAPKSIRGTMITMYQLLITAGILASFLINTLIRNLTFTGAEGQNPADFLITDVSISWRTMLFVTLIPSSIFLLGVLFLPRSPRWLISVGRHQEALTVLKKIRNSDEEADSEAREISDTVAAGNTSGGGFSMFRTNSNFRRTVYLGITLQLLQQLCGINIIMYFGPELIKAAGYTSELAANTGTVLIGLTNMLSTFIAIALIDKWGRKKILLVGYTIMAVAMMCVAVFMSLGYSMAAIACVLLFIVAFAFSAGPVVWVLCAEIQPLRGRDFGITCSTCANWFSNMAIAATFLPLTTLLGNSGTMAVYAVCSVAAIFLIWAFVPETKGVSLERLEKNLMAGVKLRDMGRND
ncbi:MAG: sugar porter family MFS transporter [Succinivibrionaceae bacterium]|jgi:SP family galactose:H+ symporter-like MFS transporter|nr:sugar porter family MFS transporter [Succinivibrionaceae bacterium]